MENEFKANGYFLCLNFQRIYQKPLMKYRNFLQTLKIQKSPMKKFHLIAICGMVILKFHRRKRIAKIKEQVNEEIIAEGLKSGKIIGKKIISNAVLDSAFYFIFDVGNPSHLAIKVPRKSLENDELPNTKKNIFNGLIKTIYGCIDDENAFLELENDKTINDLNLQDLLGQLKTQAFPLSDIITNAINQKEGVALDYALINDIKYNLLDNTFHFIFDIDLHLIDD